ncbi:cell division protein FtsA [uncultured Bacteroides sp.]|uniref:cell division protein FtsA n=1 Tax=uncultured Bacteroides sp. TaxID=162156 RepID=UPI0026023F8F|nr:cell division protein FtsA [uncultured Bacteroides sp.]
MAVTDFIAAIELGSTEITGIAGKKNTDGTIQILAYASERSSDCIKKGVIYNLDKTTQCLTSIIGQLEDKLQASIKKVYVGIGGQSVRSMRNTETKQTNEEVKISQALIDGMMESNRQITLVDQEILGIEPQEYKIGNNQLTTEPVGIPAERIEAHYLNIIARNTVKSNIRQCFRQAGYEIADYFLSPLVTANTLLTASEKRSGCALIDFGADTTTVSVYKNNILRHLAVIPLGSSNITKDISSLQIEEEDAEQLKLRYASAYTEPAEEEDMNKEYTIEGKCSIRARKLEDIVEARTKEILENVWNQIVLSDYSDKLLAGVIFTGGAAKLPNLDKAFTQITKIEKIRFAQAGEIELQDDYYGLTDGTHNTLIGLLMAGKDNCCKIDPRKGHQLDFIDDLQKKEEEEKKKAEEARIKAEQEKAAAEEAARIKALEEQKAQQEKERAQKRLKECEGLIAEATKLMNKKKFNDALEKAEAAANMNIDDKQDEIEELTEKIKKLKKENNPFTKWINRLKDGADDLMND